MMPRDPRVACKETRNSNERLRNHGQIIGVSCGNAALVVMETSATRKGNILLSVRVPRTHNCIRYCYLLRPWNLPPGAFIYRRCKEGRYFYRPYNRRATRSARRGRGRETALPETRDSFELQTLLFQTLFFLVKSRPDQRNCFPSVHDSCRNRSFINRGN